MGHFTTLLFIVSSASAVMMLTFLNKERTLFKADTFNNKNNLAIMHEEYLEWLPHFYSTCDWEILFLTVFGGGALAKFSVQEGCEQVRDQILIAFSGDNSWYKCKSPLKEFSSRQGTSHQSEIPHCLQY